MTKNAYVEHWRIRSNLSELAAKMLEAVWDYTAREYPESARLTEASLTSEFLRSFCGKLGMKRQDDLDEADAAGRAALLAEEQTVLDAWSELLRAGAVCPGHSLTMPNDPWFHLVPSNQEAVQTPGAGGSRLCPQDTG